MYHLYELKDHHQAIEEALRVTKPGGILMAAFLSAHAILCTNYPYKGYPTVFGLQEKYRVNHFKEQMFTGFDVQEFEDLFQEKNVKHIATIAVDNVLEIAEQREDFSMTDEGFNAFVNYQLHICKKRKMFGNSSHLLYICRKA